MMRWLLWGADEANWTAEDVAAEPMLMVRRLRVLENRASLSRRADHWIAAVGVQLNVPHGQTTDWVHDVKLYEFFVKEHALPAGQRVSAAVKDGFF